MHILLENICSYITDGKHGDCQNEDGSGYYFISCKDVNEGWIDYSKARQITEVDFLDTHKRTKLDPGDILITNSGTIGRMALVPNTSETRQTTFQKSVAILKPDQSKAYSKWLYYYLIAKKEELISFASGTAQKNLLLRDLRAFGIDLPPLTAQRKIAAILSAYDELIENNTRRIKILEEMAQAIYREWFVHFRFPGHEQVKLVDSGTELGMVPDGWEVKHLKDIAKDVRRSVNPNEIDPETPYFGLEHLPRKSFTLSDWGFSNQIKSTKLAFKKGEILFGKIRPYFHKVGVAPIDGICSSDAIVIVPKIQSYFALTLSCVFSDDFINYATLTSQGTKMPRANWDVLGKYQITIPPHILLEQFNQTIQDIIGMARNLLFQNRNLIATRDLLLPGLIGGELDVSELEIAIPE